MCRSSSTTRTLEFNSLAKARSHSGHTASRLFSYLEQFNQSTADFANLRPFVAIDCLYYSESCEAVIQITSTCPSSNSNPNFRSTFSTVLHVEMNAFPNSSTKASVPTSSPRTARSSNSVAARAAPSW